MRRLSILLAVAATAMALVQTARPSLVVLIVVDQMRADYLQTYQSQWTGGFRRLMRDGARFTNAEYPYFNTVTCAGHATISTGTYPSVHGMIEDGWFDRAARATIECADDDTTRVVSYGAPVKGPGKSAARLRVPALADVMRTDLQPHARVLSFSLKARSAAMLAGRHADAIAWFYDSNEWTTSTAYSPAPVPEVEAFVKAHPSPRDSKFVVRPQADYYVAQMAEDVAGKMGIGHGQSTDFLAIGFSVLDFVGHEFGPTSPQVRDVLLGLDRTLDDLFDWLDRNVGRDRYVVALSADHGVAPLPEEAKSQGLDAGRVAAIDLVNAVNRALAPFLGIGGKFVSSMAAGDLYISAPAWARVKGDAKAIAAIKKELGSVAGVDRVFVADELAAGRFDNDPIGRSLALGYDRERSGDIEVAVKPYWIIASAGASHGSHSLYDTHVPLFLMGFGVRAGEYTAAASPADIAPTLAQLAGVRLPRAQGRVLSEALR